MILRASTYALVYLWLHHELVAWCRPGFTFISCKSSCTRPGHREGWLGRYLSLPSLLAFTQRPLPCSGGFWPFGCFCLWFRVSWCHLRCEVGLLSACTLALPRASFAAFPCLLVHSLLRILPGHLLFLAYFVPCIRFCGVFGLPVFVMLLVIHMLTVLLVHLCRLLETFGYLVIFVIFLVSCLRWFGLHRRAFALGQPCWNYT